MTFTTQPETTSATATHETINEDTERTEFLYYDDVTKINSLIFDHTNSGSTQYSVRLNGTVNEKIGLAKSLQVMPGDTVKMEVYAKYLDPNSSNWTTALANLISSIGSGTAAPGTVIDGASTGVTAGFPFAGLFDNSGDNSLGPKAYLNWLVFDKNFVFVDGGYQPVTDLAIENGTDVPHEQLTAEITVAQQGYVDVYLSNDNATPIEVYFDDFTIEHVQTPVVQVDDYYPFGLTFNSWQRDTQIPNNYLFTGKERQTDLDLNWDDFGARMYMPEIGRWGVVDPLAEKYYDHSPYSYALNNPVNFIDPDGMQVIDPNDDINKALAAIGKQQGYEISFNKETQVTTIHKTSATYSKDEVSTRSNANITLTESVYKIDAEGNLVDATTTTSAISASFEESRDIFGNVERSVSEASISQTDHTFAMEPHNSAELNEIAKSDLVIEGVSMLLQSSNRDALFTQDSGLPFLSTFDKLENNKSNIILGLGALTGRETGGIENLFGEKDNKTIMRFQLNQATEAHGKFHKLTMSNSSHRRY